MAHATAQWYKRAWMACEPFMFAEARYRTPWVDDEFSEVIRTARQWLRDNPCPDSSLGLHFIVMLDAYSEMTSATVARVMDMRVNIEQQIQALDYWKPPSSRSARSTGVEPLPPLPNDRDRVPVSGQRRNSVSHDR